MRNEKKQKMIFHQSEVFPSWVGMVSPSIIFLLLFLSLLLSTLPFHSSSSSTAGVCVFGGGASAQQFNKVK